MEDLDNMTRLADAIDEVVNTVYKPHNFVQDWKLEFIERMKRLSGTRKQKFVFGDALAVSEEHRTDLDNVMVEYFKFIQTNPLAKNDYYKYVNAYRNGKELNIKFFRHNVEKLKDYYRKSDASHKYNPFHKQKFESYVLYMMLKFSTCYLPKYDEMFGVKIVGSREYNPLTSIPSVLRAVLPVKIKEYDIVRAYPTFIFQELGMKYFDVYERIDKVEFNILLNTHKGVKDAKIDKVRERLRGIYGDRVNEVITEERFNEKGRTFEDLAKYEMGYVEKFVEANHLKNYVRLHDGVVTLEETECSVLEFGDVKFKIKEFISPEIVNETINFYDENLLTSASNYAKFFAQEGFIRVTREGFDQVTILKNDNKILEPINHKTDLIPLLKESINEFDTDYLENVIAKESGTIIQQALLLLEPVPLSYHRDTKDRCDIPFKNGVVRITAEKIELISYDEIDGFFPKHSTQKHTIEINPYTQDDFGKFLALAASGEQLKTEEVSAFYSMFGYMISNYKNSAKNYAIVLSDMGADGNARDGGRGKSIFQSALSYFRPTIVKGGKSYDPNYTHVHADLKIEHDVYFIDDAPKNFNYNALYTNITGAIDCQRKGVIAETIPFKFAPKFIISTNYVWRHDKQATSTNRRFREYKFSNHWNITNTPDKYFGKRLFDDWSVQEWNSFYNFGFYCVQMFLRDGLQSIEYDKREDNFLVYFANDAVLHEMIRIMDELTKRSSFNVTDFLSLDYHKNYFHKNNARENINAYIEFHELPFVYKRTSKGGVWRKVSTNDDL